MYFYINLKLLPGKKYSKSKQTNYSGFVKLGVPWAERDKYVSFVIKPPLTALSGTCSLISSGTYKTCKAPRIVTMSASRNSVSPRKKQSNGALKLKSC